MHALVLRNTQRILTGTLMFVFCAALWYSIFSPYLDWNKIQQGNEFGVHISGLYGWEAFKQCGLCFLWDNASGGSSFFGDPYTSATHPFVAAATLLTNPIVAANATILFATFLLIAAGLIYAQTFTYEPIPKLWLIAMLICGGHFTSRLELGSIGIPLSFASYVFAVVVFLAWVAKPSRLRLVVLCLSIGGVGLAGQGYFQLLLLFSAVPLLFYAWQRMPKEMFQRACVVLFLSIPALMLPTISAYLQYGSFMDKLGDMKLEPTQPAGYYFLNLLIDSRDFYGIETLSKQKFAYLYSNYVGYVTVLLALLAIARVILETAPAEGDTNPNGSKDALKSETAVVWVWICIAVIAMLLLSGTVQQFLFWLNIPTLVEVASYWRNVTVVGGAVAICVIFLSGLGLRVLLRVIQNKGEYVTFRIAHFHFSLKYLLYAVLLWQLLAAQSFAKVYVSQVNQDSLGLQAMEYLKKYPTGYVEMQNNAQFLSILGSTNKNVWKLFYPYKVKDWPKIVAKYRISFDDVAGKDGWKQINSFADLRLFRRETYESDYVRFDDKALVASDVCTTYAKAGNVDVTCVTPSPQKIIVQEYAFPGWKASVDGQEVPLAHEGFLQTPLPAGKHTVSFRFRPTLVILTSMFAFVAWCIGIGVCMHAGVRWVYARVQDNLQELHKQKNLVA